MCCTATQEMQSIKLNGTVTPLLLEHITSNQFFSEANRLSSAILVKNIVKKVYGVSSKILNICL